MDNFQENVLKVLSRFIKLYLPLVNKGYGIISERDLSRYYTDQVREAFQKLVSGKTCPVPEDPQFYGTLDIDAKGLYRKIITVSIKSQIIKDEIVSLKSVKILLREANVKERSLILGCLIDTDKIEGWWEELELSEKISIYQENRY